MDSGDDCASSKVCHRGRPVPDRHDQAGDQTFEKVLSKILPPKLFFKVQKSKCLPNKMFSWIKSVYYCVYVNTSIFQLISSKDHKDQWNDSSGSQDTLKPIYEKRPPARVPNKHIIPADSITINKELGVGEFGVVQQGVWTNEGDRVGLKRAWKIISVSTKFNGFVLDSSCHKMS